MSGAGLVCAIKVIDVDRLSKVADIDRLRKEVILFFSSSLPPPLLTSF